MLLMGLRLREGMQLARFEQDAGRPLDPEKIKDLISHNMIEILPDDRIRATPEGWLVLDAVIADLAA